MPRNNFADPIKGAARYVVGETARYRLDPETRIAAHRATGRLFASRPQPGIFFFVDPSIAASDVAPASLLSPDPTNIFLSSSESPQGCW